MFPSSSQWVPIRLPICLKENSKEEKYNSWSHSMSGLVFRYQFFFQFFFFPISNWRGLGVPKHKNSLTSWKYSFRQWTANYQRAKKSPSLDIQVHELVWCLKWERASLGLAKRDVNQHWPNLGFTLGTRPELNPLPKQVWSQSGMYCNWASKTALIPVQHVLQLGFKNSFDPSPAMYCNWASVANRNYALEQTLP
jgi:hypothetical protein